MSEYRGFELLKSIQLDRTRHISIWREENIGSVRYAVFEDASLHVIELEAQRAVDKILDDSLDIDISALCGIVDFKKVYRPHTNYYR